MAETQAHTFSEADVAAIRDVLSYMHEQGHDLVEMFGISEEMLEWALTWP